MRTREIEIVITVDGKTYITSDPEVQFHETLEEAKDLFGETEALEYLVAGYSNAVRGRIRSEWLAQNKPQAATRKAQAERVPLRKEPIPVRPAEARPQHRAAAR